MRVMRFLGRVFFQDGDLDDCWSAPVVLPVQTESILPEAADTLLCASAVHGELYCFLAVSPAHMEDIATAPAIMLAEEAATALVLLNAAEVTSALTIALAEEAALAIAPVAEAAIALAIAHMEETAPALDFELAKEAASALAILYAAEAVSALSIAHMEETAPALAITLAAEAAAALAHLEESASALNTALAKKNTTGLAILRVNRAATVLITALAEDDDQASVLACTTQAETSVFAITLSAQEPDTRISIVSAEAPATALAIALSEEPASATAITPVAEAAPALGVVLVNVTIVVLSLILLKEGAITCEADVTAELSIVVDCPADNWQTGSVDSDRGHFVHHDSMCGSSVEFPSYIYLGTGYFAGELSCLIPQVVIFYSLPT